MYKLGEHFKNNKVSDWVSDEEAIIRNSTYRITVLTERLVRLEYSSDGMFNNYETQNVKNRRFSIPEFTKEEDDTRLIIIKIHLLVIIHYLLKMILEKYVGIMVKKKLKI